MNRKQYQNLKPIVDAFIEGKTIQMKGKNAIEWEDLSNDLVLSVLIDYRVKPEIKMGSFGNTEKAFEILKAEKFIKDKKMNREHLICGYDYSNSTVLIWGDWLSLDELFEEYTFLNGNIIGEEIEE